MPFTFSRPDRPLPDDHRCPEIEGLNVPGQFFWVRADRPPLAGMQLPSKDIPWEALHQLGFRWIACLCSERPFYDPFPIERLVSVELCDLVETELPEDPEVEERTFGLIADAILGKLEKGEGVIVHCAGGRGRTGTLLGIVLVRLGYSAAEAISFLDQVHRSRGKDGWPESKWQSDVVKRASR
jgi:protein-tyrosine phosphatase